jgi:formamidopyrimidine-DNA glycosylase
MTGDLKIVPSKNKIHKHTRVVFSLSGRIDLRFIDQRKLGKIYLVPNSDFRRVRLLLEMGPEPLSDEFTEEEFRSILGKHRGGIKGLLLNQRFIAGIGNVYGDEILFQARIHPLRSPDELKENEVKTLYKKIRSILATAVRMRAAPGNLHYWFMKTRGKGRSCPRCRGALDRVHIQGRYSYFCPKCQRR